jgi:large subunit ribosomal protein L18
MNRLKNVQEHKLRRKLRVRATVSGTSDRPRMSVFISARHISAQLIDDTKDHTLVYVSSVGNKEAAKGTMTERAAIIGQQIAEKAKTAKIKKVVLDRNGKLYHGRIQALADAARKGGLEF